MSTEITLVGKTYEPTSIDQAYHMAKVLLESGMLPKTIRTPEGAFAIMVAGKELGMTAMQSFRSINIIDGKIALAADLMVALTKRSDVCEYFQLVESSDQIATYETKRKGNPAPTRMSFAWADAQRAGLTGRGPWKQYPAAMLRARCASALVRAEYSDTILGIYDPDELADSPASVPPVPMPRIEFTRVPEDAQVETAVARLTSEYPNNNIADLIRTATTGAELQECARAIAKAASLMAPGEADALQELGRAKRRELEGK